MGNKKILQANEGWRIFLFLLALASPRHEACGVTVGSRVGARCLSLRGNDQFYRAKERTKNKKGFVTN